MSLDEVDLIIEHRFSNSACEYLVQWSRDLARTWEPSGNLTECHTLLSCYWREFSSTKRNFEFLTPSFTLVEEQASGNEEDEEGEEPEPAPKKRAAAAKRQPVRRLAPEDKIAVAKRVQMNKQLAGARTRASGTAKPPPPTAKRSFEFNDGLDVTEPQVPAAGPARRKAGSQTARKSTGGRRPPPPLP
ncbi:hypothetical protein IWW37_002249 [Coemansia sp. RSA 2050]|nr:hypothetical protein IWW37_002249 [Coemansia sp. RSA 2050]KAJ2733435.1 hypothetical protein IW152_003072 [Coemansia sp. BCRC 34962]